MKRYSFCILSRKSHLQSHLSLVLHFQLTQTWIREGVRSEAAFRELVSSLYYQTALEALNNTGSPWKRDILFKTYTKNIHNKQILELMQLPLGPSSTNLRILLQEAISLCTFCTSTVIVHSDYRPLTCTLKHKSNKPPDIHHHVKTKADKWMKLLT